MIPLPHPSLENGDISILALTTEYTSTPETPTRPHPTPCSDDWTPGQTETPSLRTFQVLQPHDTATEWVQILKCLRNGIFASIS